MDHPALRHIIALASFIVLTALFFAPAVFHGKSIDQPDHFKAAGMGHTRAAQFAEQAPSDEYAAWSDAMFSGMPYGPGYGNPAPDLPSFRILERAVSWIGWENAAMTLLAMISFYILLSVLHVPPIVAIAGAACYAFSSYNIIITVAGHVVKAYAIAYMPLVPAAFFLLFRRQYLWGVCLFTYGLASAISTTHVQITYYLALLSVFLFAGLACHAFFSRKSISSSDTYLSPSNPRTCLIASLLLALGLLLAIAPNALRMYTDWDLARHSIRGPSELSRPADLRANPDPTPSSGLDKDYAFQWSYGRNELINLLIPNALGGESGGFLPPDSRLAKEMKRHGAHVPPQGLQTYTYWGDKPFTSGPAYIGAVVCFLFIFGMVLLRNPLKWWLLAASIFLTLMALGRNFDTFNTFLFHHLPLYNKFRTVEMALVIPALVFPLIAFLGLKSLLHDSLDTARSQRALYIALAVTAGFCLIIWAAPEFFLSFQSPSDQQLLADMPRWYVDALISGRRALARADALRSLLFIAGAAVLLATLIHTSRSPRRDKLILIAFAHLAVADLWIVDRRYLNDSHYISKHVWEAYTLSHADQLILQDSTQFRVLGLNNPWQDTNVSYFHCSVGGYHAVKLRRYQELIDRYMAAEHIRLLQTLQSPQSPLDLDRTLACLPSLNMLNTRYIIYNPEQPPLANPHAFGNAWLVSDIRIVPDADAELDALGQIDPKHTAVVDQRFAHLLTDFSANLDTSAHITLDEYRPPCLTYRYTAGSEQLAVFSEIYYPGWKAFIDGQPAETLRVNWILRALRVPAGEHTVSFRFDPDRYVTTARIGAISSFLILLLLVAAALYSLIRALRGTPSTLPPDIPPRS
ncbi:MAG: YfhO family protein [Tannerellaceae bacterium]|jgi:hypothetical protein|nr:YfhO family protein [Tannerellaceae bacterium]